MKTSARALVYENLSKLILKLTYFDDCALFSAVLKSEQEVTNERA